MTEEEFKKVKFRCTCHMAMKHEHTATYISENGRLGFCDHTSVKLDHGGYPEFVRNIRHYRIDNKIYKSYKKFIEALKDYNPETKIKKIYE